MADPEGTPIWCELMTSDAEGAEKIHADIVGWTVTPAPGNEAAFRSYNRKTMAMGEMGDYCFVDHAGQRLGAVITTGPNWPTPWSYYLKVSSIDAVVERIRHGGGEVSLGPHEVPGGMRIVLGTDPQCAAFALVSCR